jgi:multiple sugar transport system substrate-binding protein
MTKRGRAQGSAQDLLPRREILRRGVLGAAGLAAAPAALAALPAVLAACKGTTPTPILRTLVTPTLTPPPPSPIPSLTGRLRVGDQIDGTVALLRDIMPGLHDVDAAFAARTGLAVTVNNKPAYDINAYLSSEPDDCTSHPYIHGFRLRFLGSTGLIAPLDDVWDVAKDNLSASVAEGVTGNDGHVYGIPFDCSPWVFFYRKSLWASNGYQVPTTWTELLALCERMQSGGNTPVAFADKDGWPALGTFDMLNLRLNGYDFHIGLLAGKEKWTDQRVIAVFEAWRKLIPYYNGREASGVLPNQTWQEAATALESGQAGMFYFSLSLAGEFSGIDPTVVDDIDFFEFPYFGNQWDAEKVVEAPTGIWVMPSKSPTLQADRANAKAYLDFWARGSTQLLMYAQRPGFIPTALDTDTSQLDRLSKKAFELVGGAQHLTQFLDADTNPDFPGPGGMEGYLMAFFHDPTRDLAVFTQSIQAFWDAMPPFEG